MDRHWGKNIDEDAVSFAAWAKVLTIRDIAQVAEGRVPEAAQELWQVWDDNYDELGSEVVAKDRVMEAIERVRMDTHEVLKSLD